MLVSLDRLKPVESSSESIDNLVLVDNNALQTIRALSVRQNSRQKAWSADFIEGKGSGQIILLHGELALMHHQPSWFLLTCKLGPPGVGKTFTVGMYYTAAAIHSSDLTMDRKHSCLAPKTTAGLDCS